MLLNVTDASVPISSIEFGSQGCCSLPNGKLIILQDGSFAVLLSSSIYLTCHEGQNYLQFPVVHCTEDLAAIILGAVLCRMAMTPCSRQSPKYRMWQLLGFIWGTKCMTLQVPELQLRMSLWKTRIMHLQQPFSEFSFTEAKMSWEIASSFSLRWCHYDISEGKNA